MQRALVISKAAAPGLRLGGAADAEETSAVFRQAGWKRGVV